MYKLIGVLILAIGMLNVSCASSDRKVAGVMPVDDKIDELIKSLDGTQWTGTAKALDLPGYFKDNPLKRIATRVFLGKDFGSDDANMSFQVVDGRLFYLSDIFISDRLVEKKGMGLCEFSPPREAVFRQDADGNISGDIVLPARYRSDDGVLSEISYYKSPLLSVNHSADNGKLRFIAQPFVGVEKFAPPRQQIKVTYDMSKEPSDRTAELAAQLSSCLKNKPWLNKK